MKIKITKKVAIALVIFMLSVTGVSAAWLLKGRSLGNVLGAKAVKLLLSTDGGATWQNEVGSFVNTSINSADVITASVKARWTKNFSTTNYHIEDRTFFMDGNPIAEPTGAVGDESVLDYIQVSRDGGTTWMTLRAFEGYTEPEATTDLEDALDNQEGTISLKFRNDPTYQNFNNLNGQTLNFTLSVEGI